MGPGRKNGAMTREQSGTIVVGVDGSKASSDALEWAANQAELSGSPLEAVTAWHWPQTYGYPMPIPSDFDPATEAAKVLESAVGDARKAHRDVEIGTSVVEGHSGHVLVEASKAAALLVVGSRGHGELGGMLLGSVSYFCVTHAHCPVVVLRGPTA